jgi:hypothetical protein
MYGREKSKIDAANPSAIAVSAFHGRIDNPILFGHLPTSRLFTKITRANPRVLDQLRGANEKRKCPNLEPW